MEMELNNTCKIMIDKALDNTNYLLENQVVELCEQIAKEMWLQGYNSGYLAHALEEMGA